MLENNITAKGTEFMTVSHSSEFILLRRQKTSQGARRPWTRSKNLGASLVIALSSRPLFLDQIGAFSSKRQFQGGDFIVCSTDNVTKHVAKNELLGRLRVDPQFFNG